ncbi:hypothetical protein [Pseudochryseolinea flava]|uniref:Lipocalin-like domain-containing protein n=1 Tax=Pseudochryseolinea flava TaxID=2059302 RepID=A0A364XZF1_9BACT|nr:hypothetical protein [Pseudochryseolinea flava]RAV99385.1 hypothetical protein DQQ10_19365 [Pseudochryseolinea flava]
MKLLMVMMFCVFAVGVSAQSIVGKWQLVKQTTCVEDQIDMPDTEAADMVDEMHNMSGTTPQVLNLKENNVAEESTRIINRRKTYNSKSFLYKYTGDAIYFLDKRSRTIIEGFTVEQISADSLIITNSARVCETRVFVRIK